MKEKLKALVKELNLKKENIVPALIAVGLTLAFIVDSNFFGGKLSSALFIFDVVLFSLIVLAIMVSAGFRVMKSFIKVSAGVSLLIFLAQNYCALPISERTNVAALQALFGVGILYLLFDFFRALYKALKKDYKRIKNEKWSWEAVLAATLYFLFTIFFIWAIYVVINPIIHHLCISGTVQVN